MKQTCVTCHPISPAMATMRKLMPICAVSGSFAPAASSSFARVQNVNMVAGIRRKLNRWVATRGTGRHAADTQD